MAGSPYISSLIWKRWTLKTLSNHKKGITFKDGRCRWILVDSWSSYVGHLRSSSNDPQLATHRFQDACRQHVRSVPVCSSTFIQHLQTTTKKEREGGLVTLPYSLASDIHKHGSYENHPSWGQWDIVGRCVVGVAMFDTALFKKMNILFEWIFWILIKWIFCLNEYSGF